MKNILAKTFSVFLIFLMVSSFNFVYAISVDDTEYIDGTEWEGTGSNATEDDWEEGSFSSTPQITEGTGNSTQLNVSQSLLDEEKIKELQEGVSIFEQVLTEFGLTVGDYAQDYIRKIFKEELTVDKLVFNDSPNFNANFFDNSANPATSEASNAVKGFINKWFDYFKKLSLVVILCFLVVAGIRTMLSSTKGKVKALETVKKVVIAVMLIYFFPYVIRIAFDLNEALVSKVKEYAYQNVSVGTTLGSTISTESDLKAEELEFRSPIYISADSAIIRAGSEEATQIYLNKVKTYASKVDMMRIMRAYAGITLKFLYVIIWGIMLAQLYILVIIYLKRYITIAFMLIIYPLTVIGYISGNMFGKSQTAFNSWCKKFFSTLFLQSIHAITYGLISRIIVSSLQTSGVTNLSRLNWLLMIIATSFLFSGEKIIMRLFNASVDTSERGGFKRWFGAPKQMIGALKGK